MKTFFPSLILMVTTLYGFSQNANLQEGEWSEPSACSNCLECDGEKVDGLESIKKITNTCESGEISKWYILKHEAKSCNTTYFTLFGKAAHDIHFSNLEEVMQYMKQNIEEQCAAKQVANFQADDTIYEEEDDIELPTFEECMDIENRQEKWKCERKILEGIYGMYLKYPASARENGIEGVVDIGIIIEKDGTASTAEILKDIGGGCGQAALEAVSRMITEGIQLIPAKKNGQAVRARMKVPIKFWLTR